MRLNPNFKKLILILLIVGVPGVGLWQGNKNNYWGLLDKKPAAPVVQAEQEAPPVAQAPAPVREVAPEPLPAPSRQAQPQYEEPAAPASNGISKLKGMSKL